VGIAAIAVFWWLQRAASPGDIPETAVRAAAEAGCSEVTSPETRAPGGLHLQPGDSAGYTDSPPTSGYHDPSPLPQEPKVFDQPVRQENAVHNLEHGAVFVYYQPEGPGALPTEAVDSLRAVVEQPGYTFLAPNPDLPQETSMALAAWNKLQTCPGTVTAQQAAAIAGGFIEAFECTGNAPEASRAGEC
jgi:hypothetical protein